MTVGGGVLGFKAKATLCIDPAKKQVTYNIQICAPFVGCKTFQGVLLSY